MRLKSQFATGVPDTIVNRIIDYITSHVQKLLGAPAK